MTTVRQLEYWKEGEKRIKLGEIENQIVNLNSVDGDGGDIELSTEEKVYSNDLVSMYKKKTLYSQYLFSFFYSSCFCVDI